MVDGRRGAVLVFEVTPDSQRWGGDPGQLPLRTSAKAHCTFRNNLTDKQQLASKHDRLTRQFKCRELNQRPVHTVIRNQSSNHLLLHCTLSKQPIRHCTHHWPSVP